MRRTVRVLHIGVKKVGGQGGWLAAKRFKRR
jgi:hypothetical protein